MSRLLLLPAPGLHCGFHGPPRYPPTQLVFFLLIAQTHVSQCPCRSSAEEGSAAPFPSPPSWSSKPKPPWRHPCLAWPSRAGLVAGKRGGGRLPSCPPCVGPGHCVKPLARGLNKPSFLRPQGHFHFPLSSPYFKMCFNSFFALIMIFPPPPPRVGFCFSFIAFYCLYCNLPWVGVQYKQLLKIGLIQNVSPSNACTVLVRNGTSVCSNSLSLSTSCCVYGGGGARMCMCTRTIIRG